MHGEPLNGPSSSEGVDQKFNLLAPLDEQLSAYLKKRQQEQPVMGQTKGSSQEPLPGEPPLAAVSTVKLANEPVGVTPSAAEPLSPTAEKKVLSEKNRSRVRLPIFSLERGVLSNFFRNFQRAFRKGSALGERVGNSTQQLAGKSVKAVFLPIRRRLRPTEAEKLTALSTFIHQPSTHETIPITQQMFKETDINWKELTVLGLTRQDLERTGQVEKLLQGSQTALLSTRSIQTPDTQLALGEEILFKLQLLRGADQSPKLQVYFKQQALKIPTTLAGQQLTPEDADTLTRTGHLGRPLQTAEGQVIASVDRELNAVVLMKPGTLTIPTQVTLKNGHTYELNKHQREELKQGKLVPLQQAKSPVHEGYLVLNASTSMLSVMRPQQEDLARQQAQGLKQASLKTPEAPLPAKTRKKL